MHRTCRGLRQMVLGLKEEVDVSPSLIQLLTTCKWKLCFLQGSLTGEILLSSCIPSSRWAIERNSTQSLLVPCLIMSWQGFFLFSLFFYFISFLFLLYFSFFLTLQVYCVYMVTSVFMGFLSLCLYPFLVSFCLFVLFYSDVLVFVLSYFIIIL